MAQQGQSTSLEFPLETSSGGAADRQAIIWVWGEHDASTRDGLAETMARAIARDGRDLLVDLSLVEFMDASTIGILVGVRRLLLEQSRALVVRSPSRFARRVLEICGLASLIGPDPVAVAARTDALGNGVGPAPLEQGRAVTVRPRRGLGQRPTTLLR